MTMDSSTSVNTACSSPLPSSTPRPLTDFPGDTKKVLRYLLWFAQIGPYLEAGCNSLAAAFVAMATDATGGYPKYSSVRLLPEKLESLFALAFGHEVILYRTRWADGGEVVGLTEDGAIALQLTREYLRSLGYRV